MQRIFLRFGAVEVGGWAASEPANRAMREAEARRVTFDMISTHLRQFEDVFEGLRGGALFSFEFESQ